MLCVRPLLLLLLFTALPVWGQEEEPSTQQETDRFLIEKITVEGPKQAAANIIRSETLLRAGGDLHRGAAPAGDLPHPPAAVRPRRQLRPAPGEPARSL